jgi:hypothetical protein
MTAQTLHVRTAHLASRERPGLTPSTIRSWPRCLARKFEVLPCRHFISRRCCSSNPDRAPNSKHTGYRISRRSTTESTSESLMPWTISTDVSCAAANASAPGGCGRADSTRRRVTSPRQRRDAGPPERALCDARTAGRWTPSPPAAFCRSRSWRRAGATSCTGQDSLSRRCKHVQPARAS